MSRNIDQDKILSKMRELRDKRDLELINNELNSDKEKTSTQNKVLDVKYLGQIDWNEKIEGRDVTSKKDIYLVIEQKEEKDGELTQIEKYYTEDFELVGANVTNDGLDIGLNPEYLDKEGLFEQLKQLDKQGILDLENMEKEELEELANELGIDEEEIKSIAEIDLKEPTVSEEKIDSIHSKQEIDVNTKLTDKETITQMLGIQDKGYTKIMIVYSEGVEGNDSNTKFSFVGIDKEGRGHKIDSLVQDYGNTPNKQIQQLNYDGSEIKEKQAKSIFSIKGRDEEQLAVSYGAAGTIDASFIRTPRQDNAETIGIPIETKIVKPTTREVREFMNSERNRDVDDDIERAKSHQKAECNEAGIKDIDNNESNDTHTHIEYDDNYINSKVAQIMKNEEISRVFTEGEVRTKLLSELEKNSENIPEENIIENIEREMEEDASRMHAPRETH